MAKCEKPITDNMKHKVNECYLFLKGIGRYATKEEIGDYLGVSNERTVRDIIALLATKKPILAHSGGKGYKLCRSETDLEDAEHTLAELSSRMEEIKKRMQPLYAFRDRVKYNIGE
jgi:hypothetical protein